MKKNTNIGSTNIETIMTMVLIILLGSAVFTLIYAGAETQKRIIAEKDVKVNARVASSYIDVKLKKYDEEGDVFVLNNPLTNENSLVFRDDPDPNYTNEELFTWIFFEDGVLYNQAITESGELVSGLGVEIAKVDGFDVSIEGNVVTSIIEYEKDGNTKYMKNIGILKSLD